MPPGASSSGQTQSVTSDSDDEPISFHSGPGYEYMGFADYSGHLGEQLSYQADSSLSMVNMSATGSAFPSGVNTSPNLAWHNSSDWNTPVTENTNYYRDLSL